MEEEVSRREALKTFAISGVVIAASASGITSLPDKALAAPAVSTKTTHLVRFRPNGAYGSEFNYGPIYIGTTFNLRQRLYSRKGYRFVGWQCVKTKKVYPEKAKITLTKDMLCSWDHNNAIFNAQWEEIAPYYDVYLDPGAFKHASSKKVRVQIGVKYHLSKRFYWKDHELVGWKCTNGKKYGPNAIVTIERSMGAQNLGIIVFTALWKPIDYHWVYFQPNGGYPTASKRVRVKRGTSIKLYNQLFTRTGYEFVGWQNPINGKIYKPGTRVTINTNLAFKGDDNPVYFKAVWQIKRISSKKKR